MERLSYLSSLDFCMSTLYVALNLSFILLVPAPPSFKASEIAEYERAPTMTFRLADGNQYLH